MAFTLWSPQGRELLIATVVGCLILTAFSCHFSFCLWQLSLQGIHMLLLSQVIYASAMSVAGVEAHECITVGDSLHHDIKGANGVGMASAFITGGIHADELGLGKFGETAGDDAVSALCCKHGSYPSYVLPSFTW
jgi:hypothetical protein